jgi:hypothetical protein
VFYAADKGKRYANLKSAGLPAENRRFHAMHRSDRDAAVTGVTAAGVSAGVQA